MKADPRIIRVVLADDFPVVRAGVKSILASHAFIRVVGEAGDRAEAVRVARALRPDVILLDIDMPGGGLDAAEDLKRALPSCRPIILSMHHEKEYVRQAAAAGAKGYLRKDSAPSELRRAIEMVHAGRTFFSQAAFEALSDDRGALTARERQVVALVADGLSNRAIAAQLGIGVRTVETHRERAMRKLGIDNAAGLTKYCLAHGLTRLK